MILVMLKFVKDQVSYFLKSRNFLRCFSNTTIDKSGALKKKTIMEKKAEKVIQPSKSQPLQYQQIMNYLESNNSGSLINQISRKIMKMTSSPENLYLVERKAAEEFYKMIQSYLDESSSTFVAEINPGLGLLTEKLLQTRIPKIHLYEASSTFLMPNSNLQLLVNKNPERLEIRKCNLLKAWNAVFLDFKDDGQRLNEMLRGVEKKKWNEEPYMTVIGTSMNITLIKHLIMSVLFQNTYVENGRILLYLAIPPSIWLKITADVNSSFYKYRSVLFQILFNYEYIGVVPRKSFLPWPQNQLSVQSSSNTQKLRNLDKEFLYIVRIEPKADLFDERLKNKEDLLRFFFFVKHNFQRQRTRIIPELEKWIPYCGPRLIAKNLNIYSKFQDLNPEEVLKLYCEFRSWPEFETSQFLSFVENFTNRIEESVSIFDFKLGENHN